jgi:hypothetical protein
MGEISNQYLHGRVKMYCTEVIKLNTVRCDNKSFIVPQIIAYN